MEGPLPYPLPDDVTVILDEDAAVVLVWNEVTFMVVRGLVSHHAITTTFRSNQANAAKFGRAVHVTVMDASNLKIPDQKTRELMLASVKDLSKTDPCVAHVMYGHGFLLSAARSILAGMEIVTSKNHTRSTFARVEDAVPWVTAVMEKPPVWSTRMAITSRIIAGKYLSVAP